MTSLEWVRGESLGFWSGVGGGYGRTTSASCSSSNGILWLRRLVELSAWHHGRHGPEGQLHWRFCPEQASVTVGGALLLGFGSSIMTTLLEWLDQVFRSGVGGGLGR